MQYLQNLGLSFDLYTVLFIYFLGNKSDSAQTTIGKFPELQEANTTKFRIFSIRIFIQS